GGGARRSRARRRDRAPARGARERAGIAQRGPAGAARRPLRDHRGAPGRRRGARRSHQGHRGVHLRLRPPRRPAPQVGRGLHHPPGGGGQDLRRHAPRHRDAVRGAAARHRRGHVRVARRGARHVRRRDRHAGRRRHQAHRHHLPVARRGAGRELPQDDGGDGHRRAGHPHQARRPPAQHAHARRDAEAQAEREGARDARDLRAARPPARHPRDQVGARGPRLRDPASAQVPGDQGPGQPAAPGARALRRGGRPLPGPGAPGGRHPRRDLRPRQALLLDLHEDDPQGPRVQRDLRPHRDARDRRLGQGLLRRRRSHPLAVEAAAGSLQGPGGHAEVQHVPGPAHHGDRARGPSAGDPDPDVGHAPDRGVRRRGALALQGGLQRRRHRRHRRQAQVAADAARLAVAGSHRLHRHAALGADRGRGLRLHAQGRGEVPRLGSDAAGLRLRDPHRRRPSLRRRQGQRQDRPAALRAQVRRHRRGPHLQARPGPEPRLALGGQDQPGAQQDPRVVPGRVARGLRAHGPRPAAGAPAQGRPARAEDHRLAAAGRRHPRDGLSPRGRLLHRPRRGQDLPEGGGQQGPAAPQGGRGRRRGAVDGRGPHGAAALAVPAPRRHLVEVRDPGGGRRGRPAAPRALLPAGVRGRDRGLRLARARHHHPSRRLSQRRRAAPRPRALRAGLLGRRQRDLLPRGDPGRRLGSPPHARGPVAHAGRSGDQHPRGTLHGDSADGQEPLRRRGRRQPDAEVDGQPPAADRVGLRRLSRDARRLL
ncbi:MAG: Guanosine-3',5'-bis(diphosphate) 3'-pyrophosphohydrolase / GTP pyrophosphokinase, (p)ppGpp synthetase II, partial [uncultured Solirubrobacteraceae bacterium]